MKRSALFYVQQRAGATFTDYHGWNLPSCYGALEAEVECARSFGGIADVSYRPKYEVPYQPGTHWWRLGAERYLITGEPPLDPPAEATDVTSVYAAMLLVGSHSREILAKLTSLNTSEASLPNLSVSQASVAHCHTIVLRDDLAGVPAYCLLVTRDYAESFWEAILHAGGEYRLRPIGSKALEELRA